jgi:hypothetical protein
LILVTIQLKETKVAFVHLVAKDDGGRLISRLVQLKAILAQPLGTIADPTASRIYPAPPLYVASRDRVERQQLPICTDWANTSARWLARFNLGLHDILQRLIAGEGVKALDPDLERMNAIALSARDFMEQREDTPDIAGCFLFVRVESLQERA